MAAWAAVERELAAKMVGMGTALAVDIDAHDERSGLKPQLRDQLAWSQSHWVG